MIKTAIILAAGKGARLNGVSGNLPKCLLPIGGSTLIERQISCLNEIGIHKIVVVVGHGAEALRAQCGDRVEYIDNVVHFKTNSLYSLWLAREHFGDGFVVLNADVLFHPQLLAGLLAAQAEDAILLAYNGPGTKLGREEMKVKISQGRVIDISKSMNPREADGENVGIAKFGKSGAKLISFFINSLIARGDYRAWAPRAFLDFARHRALHIVGTRNLPWIEIDFPADYECALSEILPRIQSIEDSVNSLQAVAGGSFPGRR